MSTHETVGARVARLRRHAGLTQYKLAHFIGLHASSLNQIERGKRKPNTTTVTRLAAALHTTRDVILDGDAGTGRIALDLTAVAKQAAERASIRPRRIAPVHCDRTGRTYGRR
jgi:transcriptional regulator with XRE-family HTH domain